MTDTSQQFQDAIRAAGLEPPEVIELDEIYRFPGLGKGPHNRAGWCILFQDGLGGCFGDWSSGIQGTWQARRARFYSRAERAEFARRVSAAKAKALADRNRRQHQAARRANTLWRRASYANCDHPYLVRKRIGTHGAKLYRGALVLPIVDFDGALTSLQFIDPDGAKWLLSNGRKRGCCIVVGDAHNSHYTQNSLGVGFSAHIADSAPPPSQVIICEGWATGCTLAEDNPNALVLSAIDAGNLTPVAVSARHRWPFADLVVAGDDDRQVTGNPGATKAREAAMAACGRLALPRWPKDAPENLTDFNDLANWLARRSA